MKSILIIDDDPSIREAIRDILEDEGFRVLEAENGMKGIKICKSNNIDIAIIDIWLPNIDGMTVLEEIKKINKNIKPIMISAHGTVQTAVESLKQGAVDFLEKPVSMEKLIETVKRASEI